MRSTFYFIINYLIHNIVMLCKFNYFLADFYISKNVSLFGRKHIFLSKNVFIFDNCILNTYPNPYGNPLRKKESSGKIFIGDNTKIKNDVQFYTYDGIIKIGKNCSINPFSIIYGNGSVVIGDNVLIASGTKIVASTHKYEDSEILIKNQGLSSIGIKIGSNVWISTNCIISDGTNIEDGVVVGANSFVKGNLESNWVYAGNPAIKIKKRCLSN